MYIKNELSQRIYNLAIDAGYEKCGMILIEKTTEYKKYLDKRIASVPQVFEFYNDYYGFAKLQQLYPWAKAIIICGFWYGKYKIPDRLRKHYGKAYLVDARRNDKSEEYQTRMKFEQSLHELEIKVEGNRLEDMAPFRFCAEKAGLGIIRNNNFLYTEKGSWIFWDAWLIGEEVEYIHECHIKPCPKECNLCQKACTTGSLSKSNTMNPFTCTSFINSLESEILSEHKLKSKTSGWIYGCDDCQSACPYNRSNIENVEFCDLSEVEELLTPERILELSEQELNEILQPRFWYIDANEVWRFKINALNAIVNTCIDKNKIVSILINASKDQSAMVRKAASNYLNELEER